MEKLFCVVYRTGGRENFQWKRTLPANRTEMEKTLDEVKRMGYAGYLVNYEKSLAIGLPETFSADDPVIE